MAKLMSFKEEGWSARDAGRQRLRALAAAVLDGGARAKPHTCSENATTLLPSPPSLIDLVRATKGGGEGEALARSASGAGGGSATSFQYLRGRCVTARGGTPAQPLCVPRKTRRDATARPNHSLVVLLDALQQGLRAREHVREGAEERPANKVQKADLRSGARTLRAQGHVLITRTSLHRAPGRPRPLSTLSTRRGAPAGTLHVRAPGSWSRPACCGRRAG